MRIISQDGMRNVPYDGCRVECGTDDAVRYFYGSDESMCSTDEKATYDIYVASVRVGSYSTKERALEVMETIKQKGHSLGTGNNWYQMPKDKEGE